MSDIAWLDTSPDEERRMRELVKLFSDSSTLDDIGIGQVRDSLADQMFPATSTVHSRARYLLFIPWIYAAAAKKHQGTLAHSKARDQERTLIETMQSAGHTKGLIGRVAGPGVNSLPSNLYWSALRKLEIRIDGAPSEASWQIGVDPPEGFPGKVDAGFEMSKDEASWLQERVLATSPRSYLAHLLVAGLDVDMAGIALPWDHPALVTASDEIRSMVSHARNFSLVIHGAALLYNLLVAEKYDSVMATSGQDSFVGIYRDWLQDWVDDVADNSTDLASWSIDDFWVCINRGRALSSPVPLGTRAFVDAWIASVRSGEAADPGQSTNLRRLIADRERTNKGEQSRLNNDRLVKQWAGAAGAGRLAYRWPNVKTLVGDIAEGLGHAAS